MRAILGEGDRGEIVKTNSVMFGFYVPGTNSVMFEVYVPGIKLVTSFWSRNHPNWALKYDLSVRVSA